MEDSEALKLRLWLEAVRQGILHAPKSPGAVMAGQGGEDGRQSMGLQPSAALWRRRGHLAVRVPTRLVDMTQAA